VQTCALPICEVGVLPCGLELLQGTKPVRLRGRSERVHVSPVPTPDVIGRRKLPVSAQVQLQELSGRVDVSVPSRVDPIAECSPLGLRQNAGTRLQIHIPEAAPFQSVPDMLGEARPGRCDLVVRRNAELLSIK